MKTVLVKQMILWRWLLKRIEPRYRYDVALVFWLTCKDARERGK